MIVSLSSLAVLSRTVSVTTAYISTSARQNTFTQKKFIATTAGYFSPYRNQNQQIYNKNRYPLFSQYNNNNDNNNNQYRQYSTTATDNEIWKIPEYIKIPEEQLDISFIRSSGAGGQNVNKVNTCVQIRFHVLSSSWIGPYEVRQRFQQQNKNNINKDGIYTIQCSENRTQIANRKTAITKIQKLILQAYPRPKIRKLKTGLSDYTKKKRRDDKRKQKLKKESRRPVDF